NGNTMYGACKDLPYELWLVCHHHKGAAESQMCRSVLTCQPTLLPSGACRTRRGCDSSGPRDVFLRGSRAARGGTGRVQPRLHNVPAIAATPVAAIHFNKFFSVAARSANVGIENRVTSRCQELSPSLDGVLPCTCGAAVDQGDEWQL